MADYSELTNRNQPPYYWTRQGLSLEEIETRIGVLIARLNDALNTVAPIIEEGGAVASVNGQTGTVVLGKGDIGLSNVDNTADVAKPLSADAVAALAGKVTAPAATGLFAYFVFKTADVNAARPAVPAYVSLIWDLGVDATVPPTNIGADDYWMS